MNDENAELVVRELWDWVNERASSDVLLAQAVSNIELVDRVLAVIIDPDGRTKATSKALLSVNPFDNLAAMYGTPFAVATEFGEWARRNFDRLRVYNISGEVLGELTNEEIRRQGTGG